MLNLVQSPDHFTPSVLGRPLTWVVHNSEAVLTEARTWTYVFTVSGAGQADGVTFRLRGQDFTTDSAQRYTAGTFSHSSQLFLSAFNLAGMLRRAPAFRAYSIRIERAAAGGDPWQVIATAEVDEAEPALAADNDVTALDDITLAYTAGAVEERSGERLYYRLFDAVGPIGPERFAPYRPGGDAVIHGQADLGADLLYFSPPLPANKTIPAWDDNALRRVSIRYGTYITSEDGTEPAYGETHESEPVPVMASLLQPWDTDLLKPYGPNRAPYSAYGTATARLPWLTVRPPVRQVPEGSHEWTAIYLGVDPRYGGAAARRLVRKHIRKGEPDEVLATFIFPIDRTGVLVVPTGAQAVFESSEGMPDRMEITIETDAVGGAWVPESETLEIDIVPAGGCRAGELYLLEGLGSWLTIPVEDILERSLESQSTEITAPLNFDADQLPLDPARPFADGGTSAPLTGGRERFRIRTGLVRARLARRLSSVIASPRGYFRFTDPVSGAERVQPVIFRPGDLALHVEDQPRRFDLLLRSTTELFSR